MLSENTNYSYLSKIFSRKGNRSLVLISFAGILLLGAFLRFYGLGQSSIGNEYYAATVKSMMMSWHNFFFAAFEPGGSISVDKPPFGFWIACISASIFGLNGFALAFPNALAGVLGIPLLFSMVRKPFGDLAGLTTALALAISPIAIATERNNTQDGLLVFLLLLAARAEMNAIENGKFRYLLLAFALVGLGFNIKMLQAYMVLPALAAVYYFCSRHGLSKKIIHLGISLLFLLSISLSWALIVDSFPAGSRPFIGSSIDNSEMELIAGHNGIKRLFGNAASIQLIAPLQAGIGLGAGGRGANAQEVGVPGTLRLFKLPMADQAGWLLFPAFCGFILAVLILGRPYPMAGKHRALILWAGWLIPMLGYFSFTSGLWHTYYLVMLGPALASFTGIFVWCLKEILENGFVNRWTNTVPAGRKAVNINSGQLIIVLSGISSGIEAAILIMHPAHAAVAAVLTICAWLAGVLFLNVKAERWFIFFIIISLIIGPLVWSGMTTFNLHPDVDLPIAGPLSRMGADSAVMTENQQVLMDYLLAHTEPDTYLFAVMDSHGASPFILAAGRPVFTFGGYVGMDNVIDASGLENLVNSGKLRYVMDNNNLSNKPEIAGWVTDHCQVVDVRGAATRKVENNAGPREQVFKALYDCKIE